MRSFRSLRTMFFQKGQIRQAPYVVVTEWYRHGILLGWCQDGIRKSLHSH